MESLQYIEFWGIPISWSFSELDHIGHGENAIVDGPFGSNLKVADYIDDPIDGVPVLTTKNLTGDYSKGSVRYISKEKFNELKRSAVRPGDILVAKIGSIGKVGIYPLGMKTAIIPANLLKFTVSSAIEFKYVFEYLNHFRFQQFIKLISTATAQPAFNVTKFRKLPIPIPPKNEQHRIVTKIEELFSELDKGIENLKTAQEQLKVYRQALLKHAFEGKLTEQWRAENKDKLESAEVLLKRIQDEREQRYKQQLAEWEASGKQGRKPKQPKAMLPPISEELAELSKLPDGWTWQTLGNICQESSLGKMLDKEKNKGELKPYLRNLNVRWGRFDLDNLLEMKFEETEYERYGLENGDLIICEGGEPGRCAVWNTNLRKEMRIQKALHRVRFTDSINPFFVQKYFELCASNLKLESLFTGTTIKHLTGENLKEMYIPVCLIDEQYLVMDILDSKLSEADQLNQTITTALQQAEALRQSILKKAFSGQLVPQDPSDEPASKLLERIKAEKAASTMKTKQTAKPQIRRKVLT
jgi:type I restriction enzyme S subunit